MPRKPIANDLQITITPTIPASGPILATNTLTVETIGNGTVVSSPPGISTPNSSTSPFATGTTVRLTASPSTGWVFNGWSGSQSGSSSTIEVVMNTAIDMIASFNSLVPVNSGTVTVLVTGVGSVVSSPAGISYPGDNSESFPAGTVVSLAISASSGYFLESVTGGAGVLNGSTYTFTMGFSNVAIQVLFALRTPPPGSGNQSADEVVGNTYTLTQPSGGVLSNITWFSGNNTPAAPGFGTTYLADSYKCGNAMGTSNVSLIPIRAYLGTYTGDIWVHMVGFNWGANHPAIGMVYNQTTINACVQDFKNRGITHVNLDWYGSTTTGGQDLFQDKVAGWIKTACENLGGVKFSICINHQNAGANNVSLFQSEYSYIASTYMTSPAYYTVKGNPLITYFSVSADLSSTQLTTLYNYIKSVNNGTVLVFLSDNQTGSDGFYDWTVSGDGTFSGYQSSQNGFWTTAANNPSKLTVGSIVKGFQDDLTGVSLTTVDNFGNYSSSGSTHPVRVSTQAYGQHWRWSLDNWKNNFSKHSNLIGVQICTYDDYQESHQIMTGCGPAGLDAYYDPQSPINPNFKLSANGATLSWTATRKQTGTGATATDNATIYDHIGFYLSTDGVNYTFLGSVNVTTANFASGSINLQSAFNIAAGSYFVYARLVGIPCVANALSNQVSLSI